MDVQVAKVCLQPDRAYEVWIGKTSKRKVTSAIKLKSLPPTSEAFEQILFQVSVWKAALEKYAPELAPTNFG